MVWYLVKLSSNFTFYHLSAVRKLALSEGGVNRRKKERKFTLVIPSEELKEVGVS
jgi:hypothetical protein